MVHLKRTNASFCVNNSYSCCNCNSSRQTRSPNSPGTQFGVNFILKISKKSKPIKHHLLTRKQPAVTYNCENFYGHYDNRKNINVVEPKKSQRNQEDEYPLTGHRLLLGESTRLKNIEISILITYNLGINIENVSEGLGPSVDRPGTWNSANQFKNLCTEKMNFTNVGFRRNAKEMEVRKDFARLRSMVDENIGKLLIIGISELNQIL